MSWSIGRGVGVSDIRKNDSAACELNAIKAGPSPHLHVYPTVIVPLPSYQVETPYFLPSRRFLPNLPDPHFTQFSPWICSSNYEQPSAEPSSFIHRTHLYYT
jgi:hypothetical protein